MKNVLFDDIVTDEYGTWTQICESCAEKYNFYGRLSNISGDCICGVFGCENEADYYLDFNEDILSDLIIDTQGGCIYA